MEICSYKILPFYLITIFISITSVRCSECIHDTYDLGLLNRLFISKTDDTEDFNITYKINLCSPLVSTDCHSNTSVCMIFSNGTTLSAGNFTGLLPGATNAAQETWVILVGDACPFEPAHNMTTSINFKCGPLMGAPKFLDFMKCTTYFEWESDVFCKESKPVKEVPCYMYDQENRYDLSPLALSNGGYLVYSDLDTDIYINVCRDIKAGGATSGCPLGSSACRKSGNTFLGLGQPTEELKKDSGGGLVLKYSSSGVEKSSGCTSPPSTTITFRCPKRGGSKDPLVVLDFDCQYGIEWVTEYACPEVILSNNTCVLTKSEADIDIDLSSLTKSPGSNTPYKVEVKDSASNGTYWYFLNVCGELKLPCPDDKNKDRIAACQVKPTDSTFGHSLGSSDRVQFRYADGDLTLTYKGGNPCGHNNLQRQTVIQFLCELNASDSGNGVPVFDHEDDCIYFFTWNTKFACIDHLIDEQCRVGYNGQRYDLSSLVRTSGTNYIALHDIDEDSGHGQYFINVCHNIQQEGLASKCDPGAAICYREGLQTINLGRYENKPTYDNTTSTIQIKYTNGDLCADQKRRSSTITFICKPGDLQSAPVLTYKSNDACFYDFEWHTAAACALGHYMGDNCKVYNERAGFTIDLSHLTKTAGYYKANSPTDGNYDYLLNVCGPVSSTKCNSLQIPNPGICQVPAKNATGDVYVTGQFNSVLHYFDGMINLTYTDGSQYHDDNHSARKSQIAFLCDQDADVGTPRYLSEVTSAHYYAFEWRTAYACADAPMECTATNENSGQEYDLSSLSMTADQGNYAVMGESNTRYYINVCRPVNKVAVGKGCGAFAAVCRTNFSVGKESIDIPDMGRVKSGLVIEGEGRLKLVYEGPKTCNNGTSFVPYVMNIHFICTKDAVTSMPNSPMKDGPCEYTILWNTAAACPLSKDVDIEDCTAQNPSTNYIFNLKPLRRPDNDPYNVTAGKLTFKLNICGSLSQSICDGTAAVCQISNTGNKTILAVASSSLDFSGTSSMILQYSGSLLDSGQRVKVQINFECAPAIDLGKLEFIKQEGNSYFFQFYTALACAPMGTDCVVQDENGNQYDLTSLARNNFWAVHDTRDESMKYYINVCRPVNNVSNSNCSDAPIGGCQTVRGGRAYNMGYIQSKPIAHVDGSVTLHYRNGDVCHKNTPIEANRNTRINFFCSETEAGPVFEMETNTCEYIFNWKTPAACPLQTSNGTNCKVVDPRFGHQFDLSPLRKAGTDYHVVQDEYEYIINVCGPLVENGSCDVSVGIGACQTKPNAKDYNPVDAGKGNSDLVYSNGELTLTYPGGQGKCHGFYERQTIIKFVCDQSTTGDKGPIFIEESFNCHYVFEWSTSYACPPFKVASCSVTSGPDSYDLSSLTLLDDNYVFTDSVEHKRYVLNVCRSLIHQPDALCPYNAASCVIDLTKKDTDPDKYKNIGEPNNEQVIFDNDKLVLVYTNGDVCSNGTQRMTTHVMFICDEQVKVSSPANHFMVGQCDHHLIWISAAACKLGTTNHDDDKIVDAGNITCKVTNPRTGYEFDLLSLKILSGSPYNVTDNDNHYFEFNVCGPVKNSRCATTSIADIGVCQSEVSDARRVFNAGKAIHNLWYNDGVIIQNFTGGDKCHNGLFERNTIISFVCNGHGGLGRPVFMGETEDCDYFITWSTSIVCENEVKCSVDTDDDHTLDLSSLAIGPNHMVQSPFNDSIFYLSVCKPLTPIQGVLCPAGAGICQVKPGIGKMHESLGKVRSSPKFDFNSKDVILEYTGGSQCDTNINETFRTRVIFSCVRGLIRSNPVFLSKTGCLYVFQWETALVCYDTQPITPASSDLCGYNDSLYGDYYNFTLLKTSSPKQVKDQKTNTTYYVSMCGSVHEPSSCGSAMVCRQDGMSFGEPKNFRVVKTQGMLVMNYAPGRSCIGINTAESRIVFKCDRNVGFGNPEFLSGGGCDVQFLWKTSYACPRIVNPCSAYIEGKFYDLSILSQQKGAWSITDPDENIYWINICTGIHDPALTARNCSSNAGACMQSKGSDIVNTLGTVDAQSNLYFDSTAGAVVLEYGNVGATCSSSMVTTGHSTAKTKINFICGTTIGAPTFVKNESNAALCIFEFNWKTKFACKIKRENVVMKDGIVKDPRTGTNFTLQHLWNISYNYEEHLDAGYVNKYTILLNGSASGCVNGTVICQLKKKQQYALGYISTAEFNIDDDILEVTYTTNEVCGDRQIKQNVTSIIQFTCSTQDSPPKLLYQQYDCVYFFTWDTTQACHSPVVIETSIPNTLSPKSASEAPNSAHNSINASVGGGMSTKTIVGMVTTFLGIIIICILMVVFHKPERRTACISAIKGLFTIRRKSYSQLRYQRLPAGDDFMDEMEDEIVTVQDAAGRDTEDETPSVKVDRPLLNYHDDSDEDMLA